MPTFYVNYSLFTIHFSFYWQQTVSRVLSWMVIYLGRLSPDASSRPFGRCRTSLASHSSVAPDGVYSARMSPYRRVSSYLAFPPLPAKSRRYLSVALSLESPPQAVSLHPVLWSPDFPHTLCATICFTAAAFPLRGRWICRKAKTDEVLQLQ